MGRTARFTLDQKLRVVLAVLERETTIVRAAREHGVSASSISTWKRRFLEAGLAGLAGDAARGSEHEARLLAQNEALKAALLEAEVLARVWRMSAHHRREEQSGRDR